MYTPILREGVPHKHLEGSLVCVYVFSFFFSFENKLSREHQTSFLPVEALEFSELKIPLVYTFFPSECVEGSEAATMYSAGLTPTLHAMKNQFMKEHPTDVLRIFGGGERVV